MEISYLQNTDKLQELRSEQKYQIQISKENYNKIIFCLNYVNNLAEAIIPAFKEYYNNDGKSNNEQCEDNYISFVPKMNPYRLWKNPDDDIFNMDITDRIHQYTMFCINYIDDLKEDNPEEYEKIEKDWIKYSESQS